MTSEKLTSEKRPFESPTLEAATAPTAKERKAFVLLSGGLDSTTALHKAIFDYSEDNRTDTQERIKYNQAYSDDPITWVEAVSINYGQRHRKEMEYARRTC